MLSPDERSSSQIPKGDKSLLKTASHAFFIVAAQVAVPLSSVSALEDFGTAQFVIPPTAKAPAVDGRLADDEWDDATT
jgi:hypothetical protein